MEVSATSLPEVLLLKPQIFGDSRGYFVETWSRRRYAEAGLAVDFVQDNQSRSRQSILRGLHLQHPFSQGKLVQVVEGEVFDVAVDVRRGSPRFGQWTGVTLSSDNKHQLYVPPGFAHGFCVTSEHATFAYKCTEYYHPESEISLFWNDPDLGIEWPFSEPQLSDKDANAPRLSELGDRLPEYKSQGTAG